MKKKIILNLPYIIAGLVGTKLAMAYRIAEGNGLGEKLKTISVAFDIAFSQPLPSFHQTDLLLGAMMGGGM